MEKKIKLIMSKVFKISLYSINEDSSPDNIESWDSLNHMDLIRSIEEEFNIEFEFFEVMDFENIGELVISIEQKM